jgi:hypothetical protein
VASDDKVHGCKLFEGDTEYELMPLGEGKNHKKYIQKLQYAGKQKLQKHWTKITR